MPTADERFWARVDKTPGHGPDGECWVWTGAKSLGYGVFNVVPSKQQMRAHRYSFQRCVGPIPNGPQRCISHLCDNRACVRPDHLYLGIPEANISRGHLAGAPKKFSRRLSKEEIATIATRMESDRRAAPAIMAEYCLSQYALMTILYRYYDAKS